MKEFTDNEKIVAKNINKEYKWMARDKSGILCAFIHKPYKDHIVNRWNSEGPICEMAAFDWMFKSITWCDEDPTLIRDIYDPQILDDLEKKYLLDLIRPWSILVTGIIKVMLRVENLECIIIQYTQNERMLSIILPYFERGKMYKNMKSGKKYTLEELGIEV